MRIRGWSRATAEGTAHRFHACDRGLLGARLDVASACASISSDAVATRGGAGTATTGVAATTFRCLTGVELTDSQRLGGSGRRDGGEADVAHIHRTSSSTSSPSKSSGFRR